VIVERSLGRGRSDDTEPVIRERLRVYRAQTEPLVARYRAAGLLREVDASGTVDQVEAATRDALAKRPRAEARR
jgi:adenylate kinase